MKEKVNNVDKYKSNDFLPIQTSSNEIILFVYFATFRLWTGRTRRTTISIFMKIDFETTFILVVQN